MSSEPVVSGAAVVVAQASGGHGLWLGGVGFTVGLLMSLALAPAPAASAPEGSAAPVAPVASAPPVGELAAIVWSVLWRCPTRSFIFWMRGAWRVLTSSWAMRARRVASVTQRCAKPAAVSSGEATSPRSRCVCTGTTSDR